MRKSIKYAIVCAVLAGVIFVYPRVYGFIEGIFDAMRSSDIRQEYEKKTTDWLLNEINSYNYMRAHIAYGVLVDRKEKRAVPIIIEKMKKEKVNKSMYIQALGTIGDKQSIPFIVEAIESNKKDSQDEVYWHGNIALANLKYKPAWDVAIDLSRSNNIYDMSLATDMFEVFGDKRAIPYLEEIRKNRARMGDKIFVKDENGQEVELRMLSVGHVDKVIDMLEDK